MGAEVQARLRAIDYSSVAFAINSRTAKVPSSRRRIYIIGVDSEQATILLPLLEWPKLLLEAFSSIPGRTVDDFMLEA